MLSFLKKISPNLLKKTARKIRSLIYNVLDNFGPYLKYRKYFGYKLFYTRGASLVERIRLGSPQRVYEQDLIFLLNKELSKHTSPIFLDIGTNIGLISLAMLRSMQKLKIFAFEPGPIAYKSFCTTIFANRIEDRIELFNQALSRNCDTIDFYIHGDRDSSGDGMFDTGRANNSAHIIKVKSNTLDNWLKENNTPKIHVVKMDIEGAELYALEGSVEFLREHNPIIFLEISKENLKVYPYKEKDILTFFESNNYDLFDLEEKKCTHENISALIKDKDTFVAKPKKT